MVLSVIVDFQILKIFTFDRHIYSWICTKFRENLETPATELYPKTMLSNIACVRHLEFKNLNF